jgi:transcriptional regulator with XRE-family HTH domain
MSQSALTLQTQVSRTIKIWAAFRDLSQAQIAERAGWSAFYLSHRLNGKVRMSVDDALVIAGILGIGVDDLLTGSMPSVGHAHDPLNACYSDRSSVSRRFAGDAIQMPNPAINGTHLPDLLNAA